MRQYRHPFRRVMSLTGLIAFVALSRVSAITYTPLSDNFWQPDIGVYEGSVNGVASPGGINKNAKYAAWLNRSVVWGHDTFPADWANIQGEGWILQPWGDWVNETAGSPWAGQTPANPRRMIFSLPMLPANPSNSTQPLSGTSLQLGATGTYNGYFKTLATHLVSNGLGNSVIRLGWEWNGNWYAWQVQTDANAKYFAQYWQQIVTTMRAVPGAQNLQFCWNASNNIYAPFTIANAWPGAAYVDYIGLDVYDSSWASNSNSSTGYYFPWPTTDTAAQILTAQQWVWQNAINSNSQGIPYWANLAKTYGKPLCIPEWGLLKENTSDHGGGDDTNFIQQMFNYIQNPANNVAFASYFDFADSIISGINTGTTSFPNSATLYQQLLGLPSATATVTLGNLGPYTYSGTAAVATATTNPANLPVTLLYNGSTTAPTAVGAYKVAGVITSANYQGAATGTLVINPAPSTATVTLSNLAYIYTGSADAATVTTNPAGLSTTVTYNGSTTAPSAAGSYPVVATVTSANYQGSATGTLVISPATATVTLSNLADVYSGNADAATVTTNPPGLSTSVSYNGSTAAPSAAGSYSVVATVTSANYQGSGTGTLVISPATATVTLSNLADIYSGNADAATVTTNPPGLIESVTYNGSTTVPTAAGTYTVVATVTGANYQGSATGTLVVSPATATVTLSNLGPFIYNGAGEAATAATTPPGIATTITYNGSATAPAAVGSYAVVASTANPNYQGSATGTLVISPATATVTLGNLAYIYSGTADAATATTNPPGLSTSITYNGSPTAPILAGSYPVVATVTSANYLGSTTGTLVISPATATVTLSNLAYTYNGTAEAATVTTNPPGLGTTVTYGGSATAPTAAGSYPVIATATSSNYQGSTTGTLVISPATATVTLSNLSYTYSGTPDAATVTTNPPGLSTTVTYNGSAAAPSVAGNYAVAATVIDPNYQGSANGILVIALSPYQQYLAADNLPLTTADSAEPDGDGVPILLKYATGMTPGTPSAAGPTAINAAGNYLTLQFNRLNPPSVNYVVEASSDLVKWSTVASLVSGGTAWTGTAGVTESGTGPVAVTVTDSVPFSPGSPRFLRLRVTTATDLAVPSTVPQGDVPLTFTGTSTSANSLPLDNPPVARNTVQSVSANTITAVNAGTWATLSAPYALRLLSGNASGATFAITAQNGNVLTLATPQGIDLTQQLVSAGDTYEILPLETLGTFFGTTNVPFQTGATASTADNIYIWNGTGWLTYYPNGTNWKQAGSFLSQNNTVIPPGTGWLTLCRGTSPIIIYDIGRVPEVALEQFTSPGGTSFLGGAYPINTPLASTGFAQATGWLPGPSASSADNLLLWGGNGWLTFYFNGINWKQAGSLLPQDTYPVTPGQPLLVMRRSAPAAAQSFVVQPLLYTP